MSWPIGTLVMVVRDPANAAFPLIGRTGTTLDPLGTHWARDVNGLKTQAEGYRVHLPGTASLGWGSGENWIIAPAHLIKIGGPDVDITEREDAPIREHA